MIDTFSANPDPTILTVTWEGGDQSALPAALLRKEAMDAHSKSERFHKGEVSVAEGIWITQMSLVGAYGVNLHFSDGHDKAVYPFTYLKELSERFDN